MQKAFEKFSERLAVQSEAVGELKGENKRLQMLLQDGRPRGVHGDQAEVIDLREHDHQPPSGILR